MYINKARKELAVRIINSELGDRLDPETVSLLTKRILRRLRFTSPAKFRTEKVWIRTAIRHEYSRISFLILAESDSANTARKESRVESSNCPRPPVNAEFLLHLFLREEEQDSLIGCLTERYGRKVKRLGKRHADFWFYAEVARSLWPLAKRSTARAIKIAVVGEWIRRMIH